MHSRAWASPRRGIGRTLLWRYRASRSRHAATRSSRCDAGPARRGRGAAAAPAAAASAVVVGIADQKPDMFTDPRFDALGIKHARLTVAVGRA